MINFCTLFDSAYLSRGLLLYDSLKQHVNSFHLYVVAFDDQAYSILCSLHLNNITVVSLHEFENKRLLDLKHTRNKAEYFWTCTSSVLDFCLTSYKLPSCTYLDADLCFYNSPDEIFSECNEAKNVIITEHRYSKLARLYEGRRAGRFCVQFVTFTSAENSRMILKKWVDQCLEWCYDRYENGKFGDQKYLDEWPAHSNVHIVNHPGAGIAPWNVNRYDFFKEDGKLLGRDRSKTFNVIFFHFHFVRIYEAGYADLGWNRLSGEVITYFYKPYIEKLLLKEDHLEQLFPSYKRQCSISRQYGFKSKVKSILKNVFRYNIIDIPVR